LVLDSVLIKNVKKFYSLGKTEVRALRGVDLAVNKGEFFVLAGPSGSGKSTLLNIIGCLDYPSEGEIWLEDMSISKYTEKQLNKIRLHHIGFIFQSFNLIPVLNVYENIELPLLVRKDISAKERCMRVKEMIEKVGLTKQEKQKPSELSGGQQQRVAIARALVTKPKVVLADEPTANLDTNTGNDIIALMQDICVKENTTFIISSHDPKVIKKAGRCIFLQDGLVKEEVE